jgi:hypothetical protein
MAAGKKVLDCVERRRLDQVDHDRRRKHRDAPGADERRGVFWPDDKLGRSLQAKIDAAQIDHAGSALSSG